MPIEPSVSRIIQCNRIAFVLHSAELLNHYKNIWKCLDNKEFDIISSGLAELASKDLPEDLLQADKICAEGEDLFAQGNMEAAEKRFEASISSFPLNKTAFNSIGVMAQQRGDARMAMIYFGLAVNIDPTYEDALENMMTLLQMNPALSIYTYLLGLSV